MAIQISKSNNNGNGGEERKERNKTEKKKTESHLKSGKSRFVCQCQTK